MKLKFIAFFFIGILSNHLYSQELKVGDKAPEIIQTMVNGEEFKLSDLQGKVVLLDFWASWCKPCRKENPNIVDAYKKFKDDTFKNGNGFTVVSVSLDFKKDPWVKAIKQDSLNWPYQISDLKGWRNEAAVKYNIQSVPTNYLIDENGLIIAINLRGPNLQSTLKKLKKGFFSFSNKQ